MADADPPPPSAPSPSAMSKDMDLSAGGSPPPRKAGTQPSLKTLRAWAPLYLSKTDKTIEHLNRVLETTFGLDKALCATAYSLTILHSLLDYISLLRLRHTASKVASLAAKHPGEGLLAQLSSPLSSHLADVSASARATSALIGDFRIFMRLWGLLGIWSWVKSVHLNPPTDVVEKWISYAEVASSALYQVLENGAYLASKGVLKGKKWKEGREAKWWAWSSRFWAAYVALELFRLGRAKMIEQSEKSGESGVVGVDGAVEGKEVGESKMEKIKERAERDAKWLQEVVVNLAWAPMTVHWSLEEGFLGEAAVGVFGSVAGILGVRDLWKKTA